MIRIRYEDLNPAIVDIVYGEYQYQIYNGEFEFFYWEWTGPEEQPAPRHAGKNWNFHYDRIYLELETPRCSGKYSFAESPAVLMAAMSDYETEINLETVTQEIDDSDQV